MKLSGGCYCGALRYEVADAAVMKGQCHCRECQYFSGGAPQIFMVVPEDLFAYVAGGPRTFQRGDLGQPVTREFCAACGTHVITRRPDLPMVLLKVGTLDDPSAFRGPKVAVFTKEKQAFHHIPDGMPSFPGMPEG